jgi:hypothetical protein
VLDITLIKNTYNNLINLEKDNFKIQNFKLKVISKDLKNIYFLNFNSLEEFYINYKSVIDLNGPNIFCDLGDFPFLDTINVQNINTSYFYNLSFYNISSKNPIIRDNTMYNGKSNETINSDKVKYKKYLQDFFIDLTNRNIELADLRLSSYVDVCYVNVDYVQKEPIIIEKSIELKIKK